MLSRVLERKPETRDSVALSTLLALYGPPGAVAHASPVEALRASDPNSQHRRLLKAVLASAFDFGEQGSVAAAQKWTSAPAGEAPLSLHGDPLG